jgi:hypothetical protein
MKGTASAGNSGGESCCMAKATPKAAQKSKSARRAKIARKAE